ncbi:MAG: hypothetical protein ACM3L9_08360 [Deltaproteobacteria bacterium]
MHARVLITVVTAATLAAQPAAPPAHAAKACSDVAVSARGEPARFAWLAKTKARANWRRKVRATPGLGTDYSNWGAAETSDERCISSEDGTVCVFTGYPCKR